MTKLYILTAYLTPHPLFGPDRSMVVDVFKTEAEALELQDEWLSCDADPYPSRVGVIADMFRAVNSTIEAIETDDPDIEILVISAQAKTGKIALADWYQRNR